MIYRHANGRTQQVGAWETVRRHMLAQMGWTAEGEDVTVEATSSEPAFPASQPAPVTPLPDDFPCVDRLRRNGILTVEDLLAEPVLTGIAGIGRAKAARIAAHPLVVKAGKQP